MNDRTKKMVFTGIYADFINGMFWFVYSFTENIVGAGISTTGILYMLGKAKKS